MNKCVALDCDGVLSGFYWAMCHKYNRPYKTVTTYYQKWIDKYFPQIADDTNFWLNLPPLMPPESITFDFDFYITSIPDGMKRVREMWLELNGFPKKPVIVSHDKVDYLERNFDRALLLDDKDHTILAGKKSKTVNVIAFKPTYRKNFCVNNFITHLSEFKDYVDRFNKKYNGVQSLER